MASKQHSIPRRATTLADQLRNEADLNSTQTLATATLRAIRAPHDPALRLRFGLLVRGAISGRQYRVGKPLGTGGFGAVYEVTHVAGGEPLPTKCVLKVADEPRAWHREAYFGDLLKDESGIVRVHPFAWLPHVKPTGDAIPKPLYCLISELLMKQFCWFERAAFYACESSKIPYFQHNC